MKSLLDENAEYRLAAFLRQFGHDVTAIAHDYPGALDDWDVLILAHDEGHILITNDRDFGELIIRDRLPDVGVIFFRLHNRDLSRKIAWLERVLSAYADQMDQFLVISERGVRVRHTSHH